MRRPEHGPDCIACTDPAAAAAQIAEELAECDRLAEEARAHRARSDELAKKYWRPSDWSNREWAEGQALVTGHAGTANALACRARQARAHIARVLGAHPAVAALDEASNPKEPR